MPKGLVLFLSGVPFTSTSCPGLSFVTQGGSVVTLERLPLASKTRCAVHLPPATNAVWDEKVGWNASPGIPGVAIRQDSRLLAPLLTTTVPTRGFDWPEMVMRAAADLVPA